MAIGKNKKRITITLPKSMYKLVEEVSEITGEPKSKVVNVLLGIYLLEEKNKINNDTIKK